MKDIVSKLLKYGIPIAISVGLAWFLYKNVDLEAIKTSLRQDVNYWWFVPVIVVSVLSHIFRALRWRLQLRAIDIDAPLWVLVNSIFGTYFVNLVFPRLGEVWRTGYIARRQKAPFATVLGSMVGDRLSDTVTVLLLTIVTFFLAQDAFVKFFAARGDNAGAAASWTMWALVAVAVLGMVSLVWIYRSTSQNRVIARVRGILHDLWEGFAAIAHMDGKWMFLLYTVLIWGCYFLQLYIASKAFTFTAGLGVIPILVLFVLSSLGMAVPSNGGLGPWQFAIIFGLSLYGVGAFPPSTPYDAQASAFAWLVWGVQQLLIIVLGIYAFASIALDRKKE
ncbi:MAG: flippase-like domain-containing protein [Muribaculaceae bacterium]|nr:flippase-like domain-containing protein [Muribaculaceae bacterium]MBR1726386.1 flippase-like domain-containing protein [Muribaculaceae bacterium]